MTPIIRGTDFREIHFSQSGDGSWNWSYDLGPRVKAVFSNDPEILGLGAATNLAVVPIADVVEPGRYPANYSASSAAYLSYTNLLSLTLTDSKGHHATVNGDGDVTGNLEGISPIVPYDAVNPTGAGLLYLRNSGTLTLHVLPRDKTNVTADLFTAQGSLELSSAALTSKGLTAVLPASGDAVMLTGAGTSDTVDVAFDRSVNGRRQLLRLAGVPVAASTRSTVYVSPDRNTITASGFKARATMQFAGATHLGGHWVPMAFPPLTVAAGTVSATFWLSNNATGAQVTTQGSSGQTLRTSLKAYAPLFLSGSQPATPGTAVTISASNKTFSPYELVRLEVGELGTAVIQANGLGGFAFPFSLPKSTRTGSYLAVARVLDPDRVQQQGYSQCSQILLRQCLPRVRQPQRPRPQRQHLAALPRLRIPHRLLRLAVQPRLYSPHLLQRPAARLHLCQPH